MNKEENDLLTQTGPGSPCGDLMRRYWQPVALSEELPPGGDPMPIKALGEELVLFRDDQGRPGLLDRYCSHRAADLSYGRLEDGGLRCIYHGWLYDVNGRCLDQPSEPDGGKQHRDAVRQLAYPCREAAGAIFAYMGPGEPPLFPNYEFLNVPPEHRYVTKILHQCNYLQGNEGNLDMIHGFFLHYPNPGRKGTAIADYMTTFRGGRGAISEVYTVDAEITDFGVRLCRSCPVEPDRQDLRLWCFVMPNLTCFPGILNAREGHQASWHVPIDDTSHWKYMFFFSKQKRLDAQWIEWMKNMVGFWLTPDYRLVPNKANRYKQDRKSLNESYSGIPGVLVQDVCVVEAQSIQDRTREHLVPSDLPILLGRKIIAKAIKDVQEGKEPPHAVRDPGKNRFPGMIVWDGPIPRSMSWKDHCKQLERGGGSKKSGHVTPAEPGL